MCYLRHLCTIGEPAAATLCTVHNLTWILGFVGRIRSAIAAGRLDALRRSTAEVWDPGPG
jgi:tRNA-guanine family transglycosylase